MPWRSRATPACWPTPAIAGGRPRSSISSPTRPTSRSWVASTVSDPVVEPLRTDGVLDNRADASNAALVVAVARCRQDAPTEVYRRHAGAVFGVARRLLAERTLAEEVVQE